MNLKHNKIFSRIAAIAMMVAMAITLLPGIGNTVKAAESVTSVSMDVILYKRKPVYAPNTTFKFDVKPLTAAEAKATNNNAELVPAFKGAMADGVVADEITMTPSASDLRHTSLKKTLTLTLDQAKFISAGLGTYRYEVKQNTEAQYEGIKYDDSVRYLDVTVGGDDNGNAYIVSASLNTYKEGRLVKSGVFVNTYGVKKPDPTDPTDPDDPPVYPEDPDTEPDGTVNDLTLEKNVTGTYGERSKSFTFKITINGAEGEWYNLEGQEPIKKGETTTITLKHGESVKIYGLSKGDKYTIEETSEEGYTTKIKTTVNGADKAEIDGTVVTDNTIDEGTSLQEQNVKFTNDRGGSATGFVSTYGPYVIMVILAGVAAFGLFRKRRSEF